MKEAKYRAFEEKSWLHLETTYDVKLEEYRAAIQLIKKYDGYCVEKSSWTKEYHKAVQFYLVKDLRRFDKTT